MKIYKVTIFFLLFWLIASSCMQAQDLHFSQFFNSPLITNPANTGFIPEGDYRLGINYRNQWSSVMAVPYQTMSAYGDMQLLKNSSDNGWLGLGGVILRDVAGSGNLTSTKIYGSVAYHQMLGFSSLLSLGFNTGWSNKMINTTNLKFPDQFDGQFFDNKLPTSVILDRNNVSYLDVQVGMNYAYFPTDKVYINGGFSAWHVNKPTESFFTSSNGIKNTIPVRYLAFLNGSFKVSDQVILNPNIYYTVQAGVTETVAGANLHYDLSGNGDYQLIAGLYYRNKESFIPMIGLGYKDYDFSFTYDATVSSLSSFNQSRGAFEFSLIRQGIITPGGKRITPCPTFRQ